jgi:hypothetical protein
MSNLQNSTDTSAKLESGLNKYLNQDQLKTSLLNKTNNRSFSISTMLNKNDPFMPKPLIPALNFSKLNVEN